MPLVDTIENFVLAFQKLGYQTCDDGDFETGYEKIIIYCGADGRVKHMARQIDVDSWTSKLGSAWDIEHQTVQGVEGETYGQAVQYMKRPIEAEP